MGVASGPAAEPRAEGADLRRSGRRLLLGLAVGVFALALLGAMVLVGSALYLAAVLQRDAFQLERGPPNLPLTVVAVDGSSIVLEVGREKSTAPVNQEGTWGLEGERGFGQIGAILGRTGTLVTRQFRLQTGTIAPGDGVRVENFAWRGSPTEALGIPSQQVEYTTDLGATPAWYVPGSRDTWMIFVHGRAASADEALRILPVVHDLGYPALGLSYRNDSGAPEDPRPEYQYGRTEWRDVEGAIRYARSHGANSVILYGFSMGGAISLATLRNSAEAGLVVALVLDAPVLNLRATVRHQAAERGVPGFLTSAGLWAAGWRYDVDWGAMDYRERAYAVSIPVLLIHGDADRSTPIAESRELAQRNPGHVRFLPVAGAGHVESWNVARAEYETAVREFLRSLPSD